jgi:predicted ester cyclase
MPIWAGREGDVNVVRAHRQRAPGGRSGASFWPASSALACEHQSVAESPEERLVRRFYDDAWNRWDDAAVDELLAVGFSFRGSLGDEVVGRDRWRAYRNRVRRAVPDFHNEIVDLIRAPGRVAARLVFSGHHRGVLLGRLGRGEPINYVGAAFFECADDRLIAAWVLGDLDALHRQIRS